MNQFDDNITPDDLRRAVRLVVALREGDDQVSHLVTQEVQKLGRWLEMAMATAVVARTVLLQIDEEPRDEGALMLWLHQAVERLIADDAAPAGDDDDDRPL